MKKGSKRQLIIVVLIYLFCVAVLFLQRCLQDKLMGAVSVFMAGNYLRQSMDDDSPLSLRWWSQLTIALCVVFFVALCSHSIVLQVKLKPPFNPINFRNNYAIKLKFSEIYINVLHTYVQNFRHIHCLLFKLCSIIEQVLENSGKKHCIMKRKRKVS